MYTLYSWELSYFSAKLRAYLRYKKIPFRDRAVNAWTLTRTIPKKTGAVVMPVLVTPEGQWLQDTTAIISTLEERYPENPVLPETPVQRVAAMLIEAWADEFWIPPAMHYRWSYPENHRLFEHDAGRALLPLAPSVIKRRVAQTIAGKLKSYLPGVGVIPEQYELIERWTTDQLDGLDTLFAQQPYLLGDRPSLADFALVGPLYAHLGRDPVPKRSLIDRRPNLQRWIERTHGGDASDGHWLTDDQLADALQPLLHSLFDEFLPQTRATRDQLSAFLEQHPGHSGRLPRALGEVECSYAGGRFTRGGMPYTLWMLQRVQATAQACDTVEQERLREWLRRWHAQDLLDGDFGPALQRQGLHVRLAPPAASPAAA